jgi:hypothetical protein
VGVLAQGGLDPAGLVKRIETDFDGLIAAGALRATLFSGDERGFEPPLPPS